jgi:serine phosphatase RsbU (regulator of sigma subunit)
LRSGCAETLSVSRTSCVPAETEIGGDWYDVIEPGAGRTDLGIADVMGRGVQAPAVMGVAELLDGVVRDLGSDHDGMVMCGR